jgi:hypothetical protein
VEFLTGGIARESQKDRPGEIPEPMVTHKRYADPSDWIAKVQIREDEAVIFARRHVFGFFVLEGGVCLIPYRK